MLTCGDVGASCQFRKRPAYGRIGRRKEDHETVQHPRPQQADLPRAQAAQAHPARERE